MQLLFALVLTLASLHSTAQKGKFNPFTLIVLQPATARVDKSFQVDIDSIQNEYVNSYYSRVKKMEDLLNTYHDSRDSAHLAELKERFKKDISLVKAMEPWVKQYRYYQVLSNYSTNVYNFYFNEYEPYSTIIESSAHITDTSSLKTLSDSLKADYIVFFDNIHTEKVSGRWMLKLTTLLYSTKEGKIILRSETEGNSDSLGGMWTCKYGTLSCLLINGVRTSTDRIAPEIAKRQLRNK